MSGAAAAKPSCQVCGRTTSLRRAIVVRPAVANLIQQEVQTELIDRINRRKS